VNIAHGINIRKRKALDMVNAEVTFKFVLYKFILENPAAVIWILGICVVCGMISVLCLVDTFGSKK